MSIPFEAITDPILKTTYTWLKSLADQYNHAAVAGLNMARATYAEQFDQDPTLPVPAAAQAFTWSSVNLGKLETIYAQMNASAQEAAGSKPSNFGTLNEMDSIEKQISVVPIALMVSIGANGELVLAMDPTFKPGGPPPVNPIGPPIPDFAGWFKDAVGDKAYTAGDIWTNPSTGVRYWKTTLIMLGPSWYQLPN